MTALQNLVSNPKTIRAAIWLSQHAPESVGHRVSWWAANAISQIKPTAYDILRANLGQVLGADAGEQTLHQMAAEAFYTFLRSHFDLFRSVGLTRDQLVTQVEVPEEAAAIMHSVGDRTGGSILVFPHVGSFDLAGLTISGYLPEMQVLTLPNPSAGFELSNRLRKRTGVEVTPLNSVALRQALRRLRSGGVVSIAGDRPVSDLDDPVLFFGRPARVPSGHVRLAVKTGAVIVVVCAYLSPETDRHTLHIEPPMEMIRTGDQEEDIQVNMRRVLDTLEKVIRRWVGQWQMFVPVWPDLLETQGKSK